MHSKPVIFCDLDGTLVNLLDGILDRAWRELEVMLLPEEVVEIDMVPLIRYRLPSHRRGTDVTGWASRVLSDAQLYSNAKPYWSALKALLAYGPEDEVFVTSRPECTHPATCKWLQAYGLGRSTVLRASSSEKGAIARKFLGAADIDAKQPLALEDSPEAAESYCKAGITTFLVRRPWNARYKPEGMTVATRRAYMWHDVADEFQFFLTYLLNSLELSHSISPPPPQPG